MLYLDKAFWNKCVDHLCDPSLPVPERPNRDASYHPRRSARKRSGGNSTGHTSSHEDSSHQTDGETDTGTDGGTDGAHLDRTSRERESEQGSVSPPKRNRHAGRMERTQGQNRPYDPENVGRIMYDSLKIFNMGYGATAAEVRAQYRALARIYHPDC